MGKNKTFKDYELSSEIEDWVRMLPVLCGPWWKFHRHDWVIASIKKNEYFQRGVPEFCCVECGATTSNWGMVKKWEVEQISHYERQQHDNKYSREIDIGKTKIANMAIKGDRSGLELVGKIRTDRNVALLHIKDDNAYIRSVAMEHVK
jgi:hypothetical protein